MSLASHPTSPSKGLIGGIFQRANPAMDVNDGFMKPPTMEETNLRPWRHLKLNLKNELKGDCGRSIPHSSKTFCCTPKKERIEAYIYIYIYMKYICMYNTYMYII